MKLPDVPIVSLQSPEDAQDDALEVVQENVNSVPTSTSPDRSDIILIIAIGMAGAISLSPPPPPPPPQLDKIKVKDRI